MGVVVAELTIARPRSTRFDEIAHDAWARQPNPDLEERTQAEKIAARKIAAQVRAQTEEKSMEEKKSVGCWERYTEETGAKKGRVFAAAKALGISVAGADEDQQKKLLAALREKTPAPERRKNAIAAAAERSKKLRAADDEPKPKPALKRKPDDEPLEVRVLRAVYPDGIEVHKYAEMLRLIESLAVCLAP